MGGWKKTGQREEMQIAGVMNAETLAVTHEQTLTDAQKKHRLEDESVDSFRVQPHIFLDGDSRLFHARSRRALVFFLFCFLQKPIP